MPVKVATRGLPGPLSVTVSAPVRTPLAIGWKVTLMLQLALGTSDAPQLLVWEKSPLATMLLMVSVDEV